MKLRIHFRRLRDERCYECGHRPWQWPFRIYRLRPHSGVPGSYLYDIPLFIGHSTLSRVADPLVIDRVSGILNNYARVKAYSVVDGAEVDEDLTSTIK